MATQTQTAELILRIKDDLSGNAGKAATALGKIETAEKNLQRQAETLAGSTKLLDSLGKLEVKAGATSYKLNAQRDALDALASKMGTDPTKRMRESFDKAQANIQTTTDKLASQQVALKTLTAKYEAMSGGPFSGMARAQDELRQKIEGATAALRTQMQTSTEVREAESRRQARRQAVTETLSTVGMIAGPAILQGAYDAAKAGATVQHERVRLGQLGKAVTPDQAKEIEKNSLDLSAKYKTVSQADMMHMQRNAVSILGSAEEAMKIADPMAKLRVIADAQHPGQSSAEDFDQLIKGLEIKGVTQNPKQFHEYMEGIAQGLNAFGDTLKPSQYYEMFKYGRQATPTLGMDFMLSTAPALSQELGGSSYGKAVAGFNMATVGGRMTHTAAKNFAAIGMIDEADLDRTKTGEVKGLKAGHHMRGSQVAQRDPNAFVRDYLLPHLEAAGIKDPEAISQMISTLYENTSTAQLVSILATQQSRIEKDRTIVHGAKGLDSAEDYLQNDPFAALKGLGTSLETFAGVLTSPGMKSAAHALDALSGVIGRLSVEYDAFAKAHPAMAEVFGDAALAGGLAVGGKLTFGLFDKLFGAGGSTALLGSATALETSSALLDKSAIALEGAAARLGVGAGTAGAGGTVLDAAKKAAPALPALGAGALAGIGAGILAGGAWAGATESPMADDYGRVTGNWGGKDESANPSYIGPKPEVGPKAEVPAALAPILNPPNPIVLPPPAPVFDPKPFVMRPADAADRAQSRLDTIPTTPTVDPMQFGARTTGVVPVSLVRDTSSSGTLSAAVAQGTYDGFMRVLEGREADAGGGGGSIVNASYETPGPAGSVPDAAVGRPSNLRYNRQHQAVPGGPAMAPYASGGGNTTESGGAGFTSGMKARNLGNIGYFGQRDTGLIGPSNSRDVDHSIAMYATQEDGIRAAARLALRKYQGGMRDTASLIAGPHGWTPGALGPGASVNVARAMGLGNRDDLHLDQPDQMRRFLRGLADQEHGKAGKYYSDDMIARALDGGSGAGSAGNFKFSGKLPDFLDDRSKRELAGINKPLAADILQAAKETGIGFHVAQGLRGQAKADRNAASGRGVSNSQHLYGAAADLHLLDRQGKESYDRDLYKRFGDAFEQASKRHGGGGRWLGNLGGRWGSDIVHFDQGLGYGQAHKRDPFGEGGPTADDIAKSNREVFASPQNPFLRKHDPVPAPDPSLLLPKPRPAITPTPHDVTAMNAAPEIDVSGLKEAVHHVRTLKAEMASLGDVGIHVQHRGFSGSRAGGAGSIRSALNGNFSSDGRHWT